MVVVGGVSLSLYRVCPSFLSQGQISKSSKKFGGRHERRIVNHGGGKASTPSPAKGFEAIGFRQNNLPSC